jgi:hypothetical protein
MAGGEIMVDGGKRQASIDVLLDEYKELGAEVRMRIDLQQRNMNVLIVLVTAISGYILSYSADHGIAVGAESLIHSPTVLLIPLVPFAVNAFLWRHVDHDANIIDKAGYISNVLRPKIESEVGDAAVLGFESYLHVRRLSRGQRLGPLVDLAHEDLPMYMLLATFLSVGWYIRVASSDYVRDLYLVYDLLLYGGTLLTCISAAMAFAIRGEYRRVGEPSRPHMEAEPSAGQAQRTFGASTRGEQERKDADDGPTQQDLC